MKVVYLPEDGTNFIPYEVMGKTLISTMEI